MRNPGLNMSNLMLMFCRAEKIVFFNCSNGICQIKKIGDYFRCFHAIARTVLFIFVCMSCVLFLGCASPRIESLNLGPTLDRHVAISVSGTYATATHFKRPLAYLKESLHSGARCIFQKVTLFDQRTTLKHVDYYLDVTIVTAGVDADSLTLSRDFGPPLITYFYTIRVSCKAKLLDKHKKMIVEVTSLRGCASECETSFLPDYNKAQCEAIREVATEILKWAHSQILQHGEG